MSNLKLGVEVVSARNLLPKDGQGSSSAFVELQFDGQKFRTTVKEKDLNPVWNEAFYFDICNPDELPNETLEAQVYNSNNTSHSKLSLGKVRITGTSFVPYSDAVVLHYPLGKGSIFSPSRGELCLKVFITDDPSVRSSNPLLAMACSSYINSCPTQIQPLDRQIPDFTADELSKGKKGSRETFHHLPNTTDQPQQPNARISSSQQPMNYGVDAMRTMPNAPMMFHMCQNLSSQSVEYALKETSPVLGGRRIVGGHVIRADKTSSTYDLVEPMPFLFVRVVKAQDLPTKDLHLTGILDTYVEVQVGNYRGFTKHFEKTENREWNTVFAFSRDSIKSSLEVVVKEKDMAQGDFCGKVRFHLLDIPTRIPPDSPLAPEWYTLEAKNGEKIKGGLMLAVWMGTQADEAYPDAWHPDASSSFDSSVRLTHSRSKVYHSPRLWYVRVNVIEAQDLVLAGNTCSLDAYVKVQIGDLVLKTKPVQSRTANAHWNEDLMFVAAEPFEDHLILTVEDRVGPDKDEVLGRVSIPLNTVEKRADDCVVQSRCFNLQKPSPSEVEEAKKDKSAGGLHLCVSLDGGYHVLYESTHYSSDLRPSAEQLWEPSIGVLELGILNADGLLATKTRDGRGTSDTYCVAKYGHKWIRTRTVFDSLNPKYNEQYIWEVFDPSTVLTIGVFDSSHGSKDTKIGKVRIRISTLETGRVYTHCYPLLALQPSGLKKMGELHLALRFSCTSMANMMLQYSKPLLPKMHYVRPLTIMQLEMLRPQAVNIVAAQLNRADPPLEKEVVEYMTDADSHLWSMRPSKENLLRLMTVFNRLFPFWKWFWGVCMWKSFVNTVLVHVLFVLLVLYPELILPTVLLYLFLIGIWNYRFRPRYPLHMNMRIPYADTADPGEIDEELDTFPATRSSELLRMRYDRLRSVTGQINTVMGDVATQGERILVLLSWRDPGATAVFITFSLVSCIVVYVTRFQVLILIAGFYVMRHPRFRHKLPAAPLNFFSRLPTRTDSML